MADLLPPDIWALLLTIITSGGIVAGSFEWLRNELAKRRNEYMDIAKTKIGYIEKALPYYGRGSNYYYNLSRLYSILF